MQKKVVIAGGTGFIGTYLEKYIRKEGYEVKIISRQPGHIPWDNKQAITEALENADMLINLAGKSVDCRYNEKNKAKIFSSRLITTKTLGEALLECQHPPELWINSSTATIYRHAEDRPMTEENGELGSGFSVDVATQWEKVFFDFSLPKTRQVALRIAIVLGKDGGALEPLKRLVKFGLGGKQGNGKQMFSWIHIEDLKDIIMFIQSNKELKGVFNCSAPNPVDNARFMKLLREAMKIPAGLPSPAWLLRIGAVLINTEPELILKSRWVTPARLVKHGYRFSFTGLESGFADLVGKDIS